MTDFQRLIMDWYRLNSRDLPWRVTRDPYKIWLSEIILQQTRVDQGLDYYNKFISKYPDVHSLANATEQEVLALWQGLGYYSRARNLHFTAKDIDSRLNGVFPNDYKEILSLKGVGEYTAAAIASFAFDLVYPVVDGNVYRLLSRFFGIDIPIDSTQGKKQFKGLAEELISFKDPALYNQSIMEFGALQCVPKSPICFDCVLKDDCFAFNKGVVNELPVKKNKVKVRNRFFYYLFISDKDYFFLNKRELKDIWQNMYEFPMFEIDKEISENELIAMYQERFKVNVSKFVKLKKHVLSHQHIYSVFGFVDEIQVRNRVDYQKVLKEDILDFPLPRLIDLFLQEQNVL